MSKGGGGSDTTTSSSAPWAAAQPYLKNLMQTASSRFQLNEHTMPSQYADYSPETNTALNTLTSRANQNITQGNPLVQGGEAALGTLLDPKWSLGFGGPMGEALGYATGEGGRQAYSHPAAAVNQQAATGGLNPTNQQAQGLFENIAQGQGVNPFTNRITSAGASTTPTAGILGAANQQTPTGAITDAANARTQAGVGALGEIAGGGANPHLDAAFDSASRQVQDRVKAQFFGQGEGSGYQQDLLQRGLGDLATSIYLPAYESDANRRLSAGGALAGIEQGDLARAQSGATSAAGLTQGDINRQTGAQATAAGLTQNDLARRLGAETTAGGLFNQDLLNQLGAGGALQDQSNAAFGARLTGADALQRGAEAETSGRLAGINAAGNLASQQAGVQATGLGLLPTVQGAQNQDVQNLLAAGGLRDAKTQEYLADLLARWQSPFNELAKYSGIVSGLGGLGGTLATTGPKQNQNTGANIGSLLSGAASVAGLFSDRRLKSDIRLAAVDAHGLPWYSYRYLWDEPGTERIGVMADEAPAEAVREHTLGVKVVDYRLLAANVNRPVDGLAHRAEAA